MKRKGFFILSTLALCGFSSMVQAKQQVCVFDLLGKAGESYKFLEEWALVSKKWGAQVQLISFQDEDLADKAFQNDKCDAMRCRRPQCARAPITSSQARLMP